MGGDVTDFTYDKAGLVATRTLTIPATEYDELDGSVPDAVTYGYFNTGLAAGEVDTYTDHSQDWYGGNYDDHTTTDTITASFSYDKLGNRLTDKESEVYHDYMQNYTWPDGGWEYVPNGDPQITDWTRTIKDSTAQYDVLSRMTQLIDNGADPTHIGATDQTIINLTYDKNGNIRSRISSYHALSATGAVASGTSPEADWYLYDSMNRFTLTRGTLYDPDGNGIGVIQQGTGTTLTYDLSGRRTSATTGSDVESYKYTGDGYLLEVDNYSGTKIADYDYDPMGRQILTDEYSGGVNVYSVVTHYNNNSQITTQTTKTARTDDSNWEWDATYSYSQGSLYLGVLTDVSTQTSKNGGTPSTSDQHYTYEWHDSADVDYMIMTGDQETDYTYDPRLHLARADVYDANLRHVNYMRDIDGQVVSRDTTNITYAPHERYTIFNGVQMGDVSNDGTGDVDYVTSIARNTAVPGSSGYFQNGSNISVSYSDFDGSYDPINGQDPVADISYYTVQAGDTLQSIAQQMWGDSSLWYKLAELNGLSVDATLPAGSDLMVPPNVTSVDNNSGTYRVYDPNRALGNTMPTHPPKPAHSGCGVFGMILIAIIAVAVAVVTAGALVAAEAPGISSLGAGISAIADGSAAAALGGGFAATAELVGIGAVAGAAGSIVSQGVGLATGLQKSFNWGAVGLAALGGAVGMGMGANGIDAFGGFTGNTTVNAILNGAASNALTQGIGVATGLQKSFNWADVAAAGISAGVMQWGAGALKANFPDTSAGALKVADGMAGDIAYSATRSLINGSDFGDNMLQGLPNIIGQAIGIALGGVDDAPSSTESQTDGGTSAVSPSEIASNKYARIHYEDGIGSSGDGDNVTQVVTGNGPDTDYGDYVVVSGEGRNADGQAVVASSTGFPGDTETVVVTGQRDPFASTGGRDPQGLGSALLDTLKAGWNTILDFGELSEFILGNPSAFGPENEQLRAAYDTPAFGKTMEFVLGLGAGSIVGDLAEAGEAGAITAQATRTVLATRTAEAANAEMLEADATNLPSWKPGTDVLTEQVSAGNRYRMVVSADQASDLLEGKSAFGSWATTDTVVSQEQAREELAILPRFKGDVSYVVTVETTDTTVLQSGIANGLEGFEGGGAQVRFAPQAPLKMIGFPTKLY
jgi:YD repeat-containing protein